MGSFSRVGASLAWAGPGEPCKISPQSTGYALIPNTGVVPDSKTSLAVRDHTCTLGFTDPGYSTST
ncbi:hypothetical protein GCM10007359_04240 [Rothia aerolata]|uniref:Uncharacterized protein n=1 Tax=Rothia aerolata TaxID=1812262 RepID=A0A917MQM3_9MICC|nr:hypothetical protein GCM10007359_04240 [Rothia aerolata]